MGYQNVGVAASTPTLSGLPQRDRLMMRLLLGGLDILRLWIWKRCGVITKPPWMKAA